MKELPKAVEAEMEILGSILHDNSNIVKCVERLNENDFYIKRHRVLFIHMCKLFADGKSIDLVTLIDSIGKDNLEEVGGISYISSLVEGGLNISLNAYIDILKDKSYRRSALKEINNAITDLYDETKQPSVVVGKMQSKLTTTSDSKSMVTDEELLTKTLNEIENRFKNGGQIPGMKTGFNDFDKATNGLKKGELFVIGGRPSMGKTLIALNMADGTAKHGNKVGLLEMEMTEESLGIRRLAYNSNIDVQKLQLGKLNDNEFLKISETFNDLAKRGNIVTDCSDYQNILTIKAKAKAMKQANGLDVLIIDHLGLMDIKVAENRTYAIGEITRQLKLLAKELDINVILLCQLSRAVEQRFDKRPMLSDLRESGNIEQDADLVIFAYRDAYYNPETEDKNIMEWIIAKQRNGRTGTLKFAYIDKLQKIANLDWR
ncbi:MAG: replicative DNA helicase [Clostridium sp.]|uniref:replicative DNA helicase n=1 Tax=Clostridium sp. TaxID=1506 RepID=UPI003F35037B